MSHLETTQPSFAVRGRDTNAARFLWATWPLKQNGKTDQSEEKMGKEKRIGPPTHQHSQTGPPRVGQVALIGALLFFSVAVFTFAKPEQEDLPGGEGGRDWMENLLQ